MNIKNKKANPKISVIITCYNYGEFIDEAIQSVQNQTFKDYELIIIDDCSTDKFTKEIIKKISIKKYHTFLSSKVIQLKKNAGVAKARNLAIKKAEGKYILCLDADDKLHKACLQEMYDIIEQEQYDIVGAGHKEFGYKPVKKAHIRQYFKYKFCTDCQITISSLFKKKDWEKIGGFRENMIKGGEDYDFWQGLVQEGCKIHIIQKPLLYNRKHQSESRNDSMYNNQEDYQEVLELFVKNNYKLHYWFGEQQKKRIKKYRRFISKGKIILGLSLIIHIIQILL